MTRVADDFAADKVKLADLTKHRDSISMLPEFALSRFNARKSVTARGAPATTAADPDAEMTAGTVQNQAGPPTKIAKRVTGKCAPKASQNEPGKEPADQSAQVAAIDAPVTMQTLGIARFAMGVSDSESMEP